MFASREPCGTFLFDGATGDTLTLADTDALSSGGRRLSMDAMLWSPDSRRIAAIVQPGGYNDPDRDLVAMTVTPASATYVATMTESVGHGLTLWTTSDFHWDGEALVTSAAGRHGPIIVRPAAEIRWAPTAPSSAAETMEQQCP